jgi:hypothetical protein
LTLLDPLKMSTPPSLLLPGFNGITALYVGAISQAVSEYLVSNTVMDIQDGTVPHKHVFTTGSMPDLPFGTASGMRDAMIAKIRLLSAFNVGAEGSRVSDWCLGVSTGIVDHLTANADMSLVGGAGHVHVLS